MIPDFKTYLKESVWNDIRKKSLGKEERVESSVNNLQTEELLDYLNDYYTETNTPKGSRIFQINDDDITINVLIQSRGQNPYKYVDLCKIGTKNVKIRISSTFVVYDEEYKIDDDDDLKNALLDNYDIKITETDPKIAEEMYFEVYPKDGSPVTNRFYIDLIDFILDHAGKNNIKTIERTVNESVWNDIRKKSLGREERVESSIDHMDVNELIDCLNNKYTYLKPEKNVFINGKDSPGYPAIRVPVYYDTTNSVVIIWICMQIYSDSTYVYISQSQTFVSRCMSVYNKMKKEFDVDMIDDDDRGRWHISVKPKDGSKSTNSFYIQVIDFLLANVEEPYENLLEKR